MLAGPAGSELGNIQVAGRVTARWQAAGVDKFSRALQLQFKVKLYEDLHDRSTCCTDDFTESLWLNEIRLRQTVHRT